MLEVMALGRYIFQIHKSKQDKNTFVKEEIGVFDNWEYIRFLKNLTAFLGL